MKLKRWQILGKIWLFLNKYKMKKKDKQLFIESAILTLIYLLSFGILSLGRIQQKFFGISESTFSSIQTILLTFIFAAIISLIIYYACKRVIK